MRKKLLMSLLGIFIVAAGVFGYYAYSFYSFADKINTAPESSRFKDVRTKTLSTGGVDLTPPKWEGKERVNILLLGGDSRDLRENEIPRSDSIMIASLDPVTKKSYLFSILRDTYVKIPNNGSDRINTAIATGGPELAMKTVSNLMGIPIQYYVYTDFNGFIELVDAVGGIDLEVEKDMKYTDSADKHLFDIDLKKGFQHLDGKTALQYVRFRHDALSDFSRTERQRKFMKALAVKLQSTTSLIKLPRILQSIDPYIETNLTVTEMLKLGSLGFEVKTDGMVSQQIPPQELLEEKRIGGASVLGVNPEKLQAFIRNLFGDTAKTPGTTSGSGKLTMESDSVKSGSTGAAATKAPASTSKATAKPTVKPTATPSPTPKATQKPATSVKPSAGVKPTPTPKATAGSGGSEEDPVEEETGGKADGEAVKPTSGSVTSPAPTPTPKPSAKADSLIKL